MSLSNFDVRGVIRCCIGLCLVFTGGAGVAVSVSANTYVIDLATPVDPLMCLIEPRPIEDFRNLIGTPGPIMSILLGTPVATPVPPTSGTAADPDVARAVSATMEEFVACGNAGDFRRMTSLYTDKYFIEFFGGIDERNLADISGTPTALPTGLRSSLVAIENVEMLQDGRVRAVVQVDNRMSLIIFSEEGNRYLIDYSYELGSIATPIP